MNWADPAVLWWGLFIVAILLALMGSGSGHRPIGGRYPPPPKQPPPQDTEQ